MQGSTSKVSYKGFIWSPKVWGSGLFGLIKGLGLGDEVQGFGVFEGFRFTDLASILRGTLLRFF